MDAPTTSGSQTRTRTNVCPATSSVTITEDQIDGNRVSSNLFCLHY